jgi:hypothetical protein
MTVVTILLFPLIGLTQDTEKPKNNRNARKELGKQQINQLQDGALLIRLQTRAKTIAKLEEKGQEERAKELKWKFLALNKNIIFGFKEEFDFCPVYFFKESDSKKIMDGDIERVIFVDEELLPDTAIKSELSGFLTAEFGAVQLDEEGQNTGFNALIIKDSQMNQLKKPFPFYVRTFDTIPTKKDLAKVVRKMNKRLHKFYRKMNK